MSEPILPLLVWPEGIAQASVPANDNALRLEALSRSCRGIENNVTTPLDGDVYLVGDTPTGNFASFDENDIALARVDELDNVSWYAWAPVDGVRVTMEDGSRKVYVGESTSAWEDEGGGGGGSGDVVGPASSVTDRIALFDGTTGKLLKDGGKTIADLRAPSIQSVTSSATVTPTFSDDMVKITAQAAALFLANPTGTAIPGLGMVIRTKDNGTARAISYGTQYRAIGITLPTTTVIGKTTYIAMIYNSDDTKWDCVATGTEA